MAQIHMTEAEAARDFHAVLKRVREGNEVVIDEGHRPVAVIRTATGGGRMISECIALANARGPRATLDEGFMNDVEEGIALHSQPWNPPSWE